MVDINVPIMKVGAIVLLNYFFCLSGSHNTQSLVDNVLPHHTSQADSRALKLDAWNQLASEEGEQLADFSGSEQINFFTWIACIYQYYFSCIALANLRD